MLWLLSACDVGGLSVRALRFVGGLCGVGLTVALLASPSSARNASGGRVHVAAATHTVFLKPGLSTAQIVAIPVASGPAVRVVVSGLIEQVQAGTGRHSCYDAFWANSEAGCQSWTGNGGSPGIWLGPPGWKGQIEPGFSTLPQLIIPSGSDPLAPSSQSPAFRADHVYHLTVNLTGKQLLWAPPHLAGNSKDTWSGGLRLDFTGTPTSGASNPCGGVARAAGSPPANPIACPVKDLPAPAGFGQPTTGTAPPGDAAVTASPNIGDLRGAMAVSITGVTTDDQVIELARHQCFVNFTRAFFDHLSLLTPAERAAALNDYPKLFVALSLSGTRQQTDLPFIDELNACLAFVDAVQAASPATQAGVQQGAAVASSSCAMTPVKLSLSGSGASTRLRSFKLGGASSLKTSCTSSPGGLAISVATRSRATPLSRVVGPRLGIAIVRSKKDPPGGQLSIVFNHTTSTSVPPDITGSWVNKQTPNVGPPWQLTTTNGGQTLDATWTGGTGHTGLHGSFHGTLTQANGSSAYTGTFHITEAGNTVNGTATFTIDNANQIEINFPPYNGQPSQHYTFVRTG